MLFKRRSFCDFCVFRGLFGGVLLACLLVSHAAFSNENIALFEITSQNCPACRQIEPLVRQLVDKGYPIRQIDANAESQLVSQLGVTSYPTFVVCVDGRVVDRLEGTADGFALERWLNSAIEKCRANNGGPKSPQTTPTSFQQTSQPFANNEYTANSVPWLQATVRLRVENPNGHDWGTGTIIDARNGDVLILTCGHIFRDSQGRGKIEVDLFCGNTLKRVPGVCLKYDADRLDLGLVKIAPQFDVDVIPVAPPQIELWEGMPLVSAGCDNGSNPTVRQHRVRSLASAAPYVGAPFHYIKVDNAPVQGRSGGGIFTETGYLVGVCVAGNSDDNEGFFVPASAIRGELDKAGLSCVYQTPSVTRSNMSPIVLAGAEIRTDATQQPRTLIPLNTQTATQHQFAQNAAPVMQPVFNAASDNPVIVQPGFANGEFATPVLPNMSQVSFQQDVATPAPLPLRQPTYRETSMSDRERATIEELRRRQNDGDEIIVIVRSKRKPDQPCEVIQLSDVSPAFLEALTNPNAREFARSYP